MLRLIVDNTVGSRREAPQREAEAETPDPAQTLRGATDRSSILLVDPDPLLREILTAGLHLHDSRYRVFPAEGPEGASSWLDTAAGVDLVVDLVITEMVFPHAALEAGSDFLEHLRTRFPQVPVMVLTEAVPRLALRSPVDAVVAKPPDMDDLLRRVDRLLERARESVVRGIALVSLLQLLELERKTCLVTAVDAGTVETGRIGRLWLREGRLVHAETGPLTGKAALFEMLAWPAPVLRFADRREGPATIEAGIQELLLEYFVNEDHARRG